MADEVSARRLLAERPRLVSIAYRMLGAVTDAEDAVQECFVRWYRLSSEEREAIQVPQAWLTRVLSRICLDLLGSARARREHYVGQWLPEPVPGDGELLDVLARRSVAAEHHPVDPADRVLFDDSVSMALMVVLERLTPAERVVFVLHEVFAMPFEEIAGIVDRTPAACRKLGSTARRAVSEARRHRPSDAEHRRLVDAFRHACDSGDLERVVAMLDPDAVTISDGGGVANAARNAVHGADRVARFLLGILAKRPTMLAEPATVGDRAGIVFREAGRLVAVVSLDIHDERISDVWIMMNPAKLGGWLGATETEGASRTDRVTLRDAASSEQV